MWETLDANIRQNDDDNDGLITWIEYKHSQFGKWEDAETEIDAVSQIFADLAGTQHKKNVHLTSITSK